MMEGELRWISMDEPRVGCGERLYVISAIGRTRTRIFAPALLTEMKIPHEDRCLRTSKLADEDQVSRRRVRAIIRRNAREFAKYGFRFSKGAVERALRAIA